jgi:5-methylcytosine-specific restriction endonuclease McrA
LSRKNQITVRTLDGEIKKVVKSSAFAKPKGRRAELNAARRTEHWRRLRIQVLKRADARCEVCGAGGCRLEVHHLTYERLREELLTDVLLLCQPCHAKEHKRQVRLKAARDVEAARVFASIGKGTTLAR